MILLTEVIGRSAQGMTRPFLCRDADGKEYYVKGRGAGLRSLCCEWLGSNLARMLGLPIPEFHMAEVARAVLSQTSRPDIGDLGASPVFASLRALSTREISWADLAEIPQELQAKVFWADRWLANEDRSLSTLGGNPNLLVREASEADCGLVVFDFNLAFDPSFDAERQAYNHVFRGSKCSALLRSQLIALASQAEFLVADLLSTLPKEWHYLEGDETLPAQIEGLTLVQQLSLPATQPELFFRPL